MIKKFIDVRNVGRFRKLVQSGDVQLKKYTLILADNGVGKTTLCDIIRSLQTNDPSYVIGRRTLGSSAEPKVVLQLADGSQAKFANGSWNAQPSGVTIFDATYVRDNIHAGEMVETAHKRNLFQVVVGADGVELARKVDRLETDRAALNGPIREAEGKIKLALPVGMTPAKLLKIVADPDIDSKLLRAERNLRSAKELASLKGAQILEPVPVPSIPQTLRTVLSRTLDDVSDGAEVLLRNHVVHLEAADAARWLARGTDILAKSSSCPFCRQNIDQVDIIAAYRACFSESFRQLERDVRSIAEQIARQLPNELATTFRAIDAENQKRLADRKAYVGQVHLPDTDADVCVQVVDRVRAFAEGAVHEKLQNILTPTNLPNDFDATVEQMVGCVSKLTAYNEAVAAANAAFAAHIGATEANDTSALRSRLENLKVIKRRHEEPLVSACAAYAELLSKRKRLGDEKTTARKDLTDYMDSVVSQYEGHVNGYLRKFGVNFRIQGTTTEFPKGLPSSTYKVQIDGVEVGLGTGKTDNAEPSFKNTLSAGDRSALALAFFMAELDRTTTSPELAVILDDPFQSQDEFRKYATAHRVREAGDKCGQVIMFSHDPQFLKTVWDLLPKNDRKCLMMKASSQHVSIADLDIDIHVRGDHLKQLEHVQRFLELGDGDLSDVVRNLRPLLEWYCRSHCPGQYERHTLGEIIGAVRKAGEEHQLSEILSDLTEINDYTQNYHHASSAVSGSINSGELSTFCSLTIDILRARAVLN